MTTEETTTNSLDPQVVEAFEQAQRSAIQLLGEVFGGLSAGMSETDIIALAKDRAGSHGFTDWFQPPEVRINSTPTQQWRPSTKRKLEAGDMVEIGLAPATAAAYGSIRGTVTFGVEGEADIVTKARELCRASVGYTSRWKCTGEVFVFAGAWANNRRMTLGDTTNVGHSVFWPHGAYATAWPRLARAATLLRRHQVEYLNHRRLHGLYAIQPRICDASYGCAFGEMVLVDGDEKRIIGRSGPDEIGSW